MTTTLLEDFSGASLRTTIGDPSNPLWAAYSQVNQGAESGVLDTIVGAFRLAFAGPALNLPSAGPYLQFAPYSNPANGYVWPDGFAQSYVESGTFDAACTELVGWITSSRTILSTFRSDGGESFQVGTYVKPHGYLTASQGQHYYHGFNPRWYAGRPRMFVVTWTPQHRVGTTGEPGPDPEFNSPTLGSPVHYFDGLTRFYFDLAPYAPADLAAFNGTDFLLDDLSFGSQPGAPLDLVSSFTACHTTGDSSGAYEVGWNNANPVPNATLTAHVYHGPAPLQNPDGTYNGAGSDGGTVTMDTGYSIMTWTSPPMAPAPTYYFLIVPSGRSVGYQLAMPSSPAPPPSPPTVVVLPSLGRHRLGGRIQLAFAASAVPLAAPSASVYSAGGVLVETLPLWTRDGGRTFAAVVFAGTAYAAGTYTVSATLGSRQYQVSFELVAGGDPAGSVISLYEHEGAGSRAVIAQTASGRLYQGDDPWV